MHGSEGVLSCVGWGTVSVWLACGDWCQVGVWCDECMHDVIHICDLYDYNIPRKCRISEHK